MPDGSPLRRPTTRRGSAQSDADLLSLLRREEQAAARYQDAVLSAGRAEALAYYDRAPFGSEEEGRSQVVTSEFADVIESVMPGLMRVFTGTDDLARFAPLAPGQEKWAAEASAYVPHVLMRQNDGFRILSALLKDALMFRLGGVAVDVETVDDTLAIPVAGLPDDAIDLLMAEAEATGAAASLEATPGGEGEEDAVRMTWPRRRVVVESIAPEDIRFSPAARDEDNASYIGFIRRASASDLVRLGLTPDEVAELRSAPDLSAGQAGRSGDLADETGRGGDLGDGTPDSERPLWLVVAWIRADDDGDGLSELLRVVYVHTGGPPDGGGRIVQRQRWEGPADIALATPILMPHAIVGRSLFDQTKDLQQLGSVLTRGLLDNLYQVNQPRPVVSDQVNIDSLIDWAPGSPIRLKPGARPGDSHVSWLQVPYSLDSSYWTGTLSLLLFAFDTSHRSGSFSGPALPATVETGEFNPAAGQGRRSIIRACRPLIDGGDPQIQIGARETQQSGVSYAPATGLTAAGLAPVYSSGRYFRVRATQPAAAVWSNMQGIDDLDVRPAGAQ